MFVNGVVEVAGCPLAYKVVGEGPPVVFLQGVGLHGDGWLPQTEVLRARYRCVTVDNRGIGLSKPVGAALSIDRMAKDTLAVMDALGIAEAHLVGHSMGGAICLQTALIARERIKSLALTCTSAKGSDSVTISSKLLGLTIRGHIGPLRTRNDAYLEIIMPDSYLATVDRVALAARLKPLFGHELAELPPIASPQLFALVRYNAAPQLYKLAGIRTLAISAAEDFLFPPKRGKALAAGIPGARYLEFPNAAHGLPMQCPELYNRALEEHLAAG